MEERWKRNRYSKVEIERRGKGEMKKGENKKSEMEPGWKKKEPSERIKKN
jgi:hypothetical protein